ncbi:hypothetical protein DPSP01_000313 [Paraphaeosphaeria sporulosa]|uniref:3'-phosphate/5'-hydroxy nucleic acid ligase n=1 Tax=Paraphaeosphaeria sporulosa TaxID=1460663 RepID=A0A177CYY7_9PLEO|nr:release factor H-coupled R [Paraphaeosphaeria sporulosa]OAG12754.1 release factor H-coupled R [Paraphaeosphaeria sporulosa]
MCSHNSRLPPTRVTIALNTNQTQRAPLLLPSNACPDPNSPTSICKLVFKAAQSKLRIKKPSRIFIAGSGAELVGEEDWKRAIRNDVSLLISAGEDYVGVNREAGVHPEANPTCPIHVLASTAALDKLSLDQLQTTAHTLPGLVHAVGQPDLHPGFKFPIGAVFVSQGWIHPPLIGGDIGCGMAWFRTRLSREQVEGDKGSKVAEKLRGLEGAWRTAEERERWLEDGEGNCGAGEEWDGSLGTIGAGNHFAEIQVVEEAEVGCGLVEGEVVLLVHSGSRGYGSSVLKKYTSEGQVSLKEDSAEAREYLEEHDRACRWAKANRDLIALRFLSCLEPGQPAWSLGKNDTDVVNVHDAIPRAKTELCARRVVDIWHNNVERVRWPPATAKIGDTYEQAAASASSGTDAYIHRKGAAPTLSPGTSLPLIMLPLPGSRDTPTLILAPQFPSSTSHGLKNAFSLAHGAGRSMSRAKALSTLSHKYKVSNLLKPRGGKGTWLVCESKDLVFEEAPEAYKDVEAVGADLVEFGAARRVGWCRARINYKCRDERGGGS